MAKPTPHSHVVTRGSMKMAHNNDRRDDFRLKYDEVISPEEAAKATERLQREVKSRFCNLDWLQKYGK